jgi:Chaperone for flagella basal body P-ring formation
VSTIEVWRLHGLLRGLLRGLKLVVCLAAGWGLCSLALVAGAGQIPAGGGQDRASLVSQGLVLRELRWDSVLRRSWAVFANPAHPERPAVVVPAEPAEAARAEAEFAGRGTEARPVPVVHAGDRVRLWSAERNLRLQLTAVAEEDGAVGELVRVRIAGAAWAVDAAAQTLRGVVRGAADVELEP